MTFAPLEANSNAYSRPRPTSSGKTAIRVASKMHKNYNIPLPAPVIIATLPSNLSRDILYVAAGRDVNYAYKK